MNYTRDLTKEMFLEGWHSIIDEIFDVIDTICAVNAVDAVSFQQIYQITDFKQKYGEMRIQFNIADDLTQKIKSIAEKSTKTCMVCGKKGKTRNIKENEHLYTLCKSHAGCDPIEMYRSHRMKLD